MSKVKGKCDHVIGLLRGIDDSDLVTFYDLAQYEIGDCDTQKAFEKMYGENCKRKHFTMEDYIDLRKSTNLSRFKHCPNCGEAIDWKAMKERVPISKAKLIIAKRDGVLVPRAMCTGCGREFPMNSVDTYCVFCGALFVDESEQE